MEIESTPVYVGRHGYADSCHVVVQGFARDRVKDLTALENELRELIGRYFIGRGIKPVHFSRAVESKKRKRQVDGRDRMTRRVALAWEVSKADERVLAALGCGKQSVDTVWGYLTPIPDYVRKGAARTIIGLAMENE